MTLVLNELNQTYEMVFTVQVMEMTLMLKLLIQSYEMVIMNFWYSKHYGARVGDDFIAKKTNLNGAWNSMVQVLEMTLMLK